MEDAPSTKAFPEEQHLKILKKKFKIESFKPEQWTAISAIIYDKRDVFIIAGTGFGKSLIYQFVPVFLRKIAIIISPLISLMEDQVLALQSKGITAHLFSPKNSERKVDLSDYQLIYMTPELFQAEKGRFKLEQIREQICLVAIDECHCVTQWGTDFRKKYRKLVEIKTFLPGVPIVCLTATATDHCQIDVSQALALVRPLVVNADLNRPNLEFTVHHKGSSFMSDIRKYVAEIKGTVIIYVLRRKEANEYAHLLRREGFECEPYHAALSAKKRTAALKAFSDGKLQIVCATIAFGMGIDRADVRAVIHYGSPRNLESYYQESGRAGRDGKPSKCIIFWKAKDFVFHRRWLQLKKNKLPSEYLQHCENLIVQMENFLTTNNCRRLEILRYFKSSTTELPVHESCCDNCVEMLHKNVPMNLMYENIDNKGLLDVSADVRTLLSLVQAYKGRCKQRGFLKLLIGELPTAADVNHPLGLFAKGKTKPEEWWSLLLKILTKSKMIKGHIEVRHIPLPRAENDDQNVPEMIVRREDFFQLTRFGAKFLLRKTKTFHLPPSAEIFPFLKKTSVEYFIENGVVRNKPRTPRAQTQAKVIVEKSATKRENLFNFQVPSSSRKVLKKLEEKKIVNDGAGCSSWKRSDEYKTPGENESEDPEAEEVQFEDDEDENLERMNLNHSLKRQTKPRISVDFNVFLHFLESYNERETSSQDALGPRNEQIETSSCSQTDEFIEKSSWTTAVKHKCDTESEIHSKASRLV